MKNQLLVKTLDRTLFHYLAKHVENMPLRFVKFIAHYYTDARIRKLYWKRLGVYMGKNTFPNLGFKATSIGENLIFIGNNVSIAPNVTIIADSCANNGVEINQIQQVTKKFTKKEKVYIEDEVWIGTGVIILPGIHIGRCTVIGAGSVVTKDLDSYSVYMGIPAKKVTSLIKPDYKKEALQ